MTEKGDLNVFHGENCQGNSLQSQNRLMTVTGEQGRPGENGEGTKQKKMKDFGHRKQDGDCQREGMEDRR